MDANMSLRTGKSKNVEFFLKKGNITNTCE